MGGGGGGGWMGGAHFGEMPKKSAHSDFEENTKSKE